MAVLPMLKGIRVLQLFPEQTLGRLHVKLSIL